MLYYIVNLQIDLNVVNRANSMDSKKNYAFVM